MAADKKKPYRIGVALSGGGARGFAHVGALKAMEELGLKPDIVSGVSAGSVVAVLYGAGVPLDKIMQLFSDVSVRDFMELKLKGGGFFSMTGFRDYIMKAIRPYVNLEDLPLPTMLGATNFDKGAAVAFDKGEIGDRMMASCSIPIIFRPVEIDGVRYVDGGVLRNLPAWIIRDKCETLIGINCSPLVNRHLKNTVMDNAVRAYNLMAKSNQRDDMEMCDIAISLPEIAKYNVFNLKEIRQVYIRGYAQTKKRLKQWLQENPLP